VDERVFHQSREIDWVVVEAVEVDEAFVVAAVVGDVREDRGCAFVGEDLEVEDGVEEEEDDLTGGVGRCRRCE